MGKVREEAVHLEWEYKQVSPESSLDCADRNLFMSERLKNKNRETPPRLV